MTRRKLALRWTVLVAMLLPLLAIQHAQPSLAHASWSVGVSATSTQHGLRMTLSLPRRAYPRDALVRATVTADNVSGRRLYYDVSNGETVLVRNRHGRDVFQSAQPLGANSLVITRGSFRWRILRSGAAFTFHIYLVLRGRMVIAESNVSPALSGPWTTVVTPPVYLRLTNEAVPEATLASTPGLSVTVTHPWPVAGRLHYLWQTSCTTASGTETTEKGWTSTADSTIKTYFYSGQTGVARLSCSGSGIWNGLAGWLNHPVASFSYRIPALR